MTTAKPLFIDRPISKSSDDLLGRTPFAKKVATAITAWQGADSLVLALYGEWGTGKTSLKNLVLEEIAQTPEPRPVVVQFNPWHWAGHEQITEAFFTEVGKVLGKDFSGGRQSKLEKKWQAYAAALRVRVAFVDGAQKILGLLLGVIGVLGLGAYLQAEWFKLIATIAGLTAAVLLLGYTVVSRFSKAMAERYAAIANLTRKTLVEAKAELVTALAAIDRPILVVIDDVDRLTTEEIQFLFRMVKANADLPNFIYFVLFDRDLVERALAPISNGKGAQFLQKIVHIGIDVPALDRTRLEKYLEAELEKTFRDTRVSRFFDEARWGNLFVGSLRTYFRTLRDVKRYLSAFTFHADIFLSPQGFDINPVDLAAIEVVRLFEPSVYQGIRSARDALLSIRSDSEAPDLRSQLSEIGAQCPPGVQASIRELIQQLFPQAEWVWGRNIQYQTTTMEQWSRELRICSASHFDRYFLLALGTNELSTAEAEHLVSISGDRTRLSAGLRRLADRGLLAAAIDALADRMDKIDVRNGVPFLTAICDMADELPDRRFEDEPGVSFLDAARLVSRYLRQCYEPTNRAAILRQVIGATSGIAVPVVLVSRESDPAFRSGSPQETFLDEGEVSEIQASCRTRIDSLSRTPPFIRIVGLGTILRRWMEWGGGPRAREWASQCVRSDSELPKFVAAFLQKSREQTYGEHVSRTKWSINLSVLERFVDAQELQVRVHGINRANLRGRDSLAIDTCLQAYDRRKRRLPDADTWDDE